MKDEATPLRWHADADPLVIGDLAAVPLVKGPLATVRSRHVTRRFRDVAFVCVGISCRASTSSARMIVARWARRRRSRSSSVPRSTCRWWSTPLAHAFHKQTQEHSQAISAQGEEAFLEHMAAIGEGARLERWQRRDELARGRDGALVAPCGHRRTGRMKSVSPLWGGAPLATARPGAGPPVLVPGWLADARAASVSRSSRSFRRRGDGTRVVPLRPEWSGHGRAERLLLAADQQADLLAQRCVPPWSALPIC